MADDTHDDADIGMDRDGRTEHRWAPPSQAPLAAPPGYVTYGGAPTAVQPTAFLRNASVGVRLGAAAASVATGFLYLHRAAGIDRVESGRGGGGISTAKTLTTLANQFSTVLGLAGLVFLCVWSSRTVTNGTIVHHNTRASPALAGGGWFIPIGNCWVPWRHLRRAMGGSRRSAALGWWQGISIASMVAAIPLGVVAGIAAFRDAIGRDVSAGMVRIQGITILASAAFAVVTTLISIRAMRDVDEATSGPAGWFAS